MPLIYEISFAHKRPNLKNLPYVRIRTAGKETGYEAVV
jgi:hypothetical protein